MSVGTAGGGKVGAGAAAGASTSTQDPEDVFELPPFYDYVTPLDRARRTPVRALEYRDCSEVYDHRRQDRARCEVQIAEALRDPQFVPDAASVMAGADFTDPAALTPLQAALTEAFLNPWNINGSLIDQWGGARGPAFALEAFAEFCRAMGIDARILFGMASGPTQRRPDIMRLLDLLRSAPEREYAEASAVAERLRENGPGTAARALTTFLFPERPEWFRADLEAASQDPTMAAATWLVPSVSTVEQAAALGEYFRKLPEWRWDIDGVVELTFLKVAGAEALPFLIAWCDSGHRCPRPFNKSPRPCAIHKRCLDMMARIPTEAAMVALVERMRQDGVGERLQAAITRFPRRALRVLAETEVTDETTRLLLMVVLADPGFARAEADRLGPRARARVEALLGDDAPDGEVLDLPEILAAPPWRDKKRKRPKPIVVEGLTPADDAAVSEAEVTVAWLPGEREAWLAAHGAGWVPDQGWEAARREIADGTANESLATYFAAYGPDDLVRSQLAEWQPPMRQVTNRARTFVARHEFYALPTVLSMTRFPPVRAQLLQPFVSPEIAAIMADGLVRLRSMRTHAASWLRRHPEDAVRSLVPTALGKPGKLRQNTVAALRWLEADGVDVVTIAQRVYGEDAATAMKEVLADRGFEAYPRTVPQPPLWARAALLSEIRLKDGGTTLPQSAAQAVVEMVMFSKPDAVYPGLEIVKEVCDAASLAAFVWSLAGNWEQSGGDEKDRWVVGALGVFGDQDTVARLEGLIRDWHRRSKYLNVYDGFAALATIGGDRALTALHGFSRRSWATSLKRRAQATFEDVADAMDLTADRLADRLVPTSGLTAEGTFRLDYGHRGFDVSFDEFLRPVVTDDGGEVLKALPKPGKRDDAELATASRKRFVALKKQVQDGAREQSARLERAMLDRRRWNPEEFGAYLVRHLVLGRLVRRLVWGVYAEDGGLLGSFRIAEDLSFADIDDARYEVPEGALIGVVHPVDLGLELARWSEVFSDYEILQPFDQLGRTPLALTAEEREGKRLLRPYIRSDALVGTPAFAEVGLPPSRFEAMASRDWQRGPIAPGRVWTRLLRPLGDGRHVIVDLEPGLEAGAPALSPYQAVVAVWLSATGDAPDFERDALPLSALDSVFASSVLRDLEEVS